jgi:hypothetical protein
MARCPICGRLSRGICIRCLDEALKIMLIEASIDASQNLSDEPQTYYVEDE